MFARVSRLSGLVPCRTGDERPIRRPERGGTRGTGQRADEGTALSRGQAPGDQGPFEDEQGRAQGGRRPA